MTNSVSQYEKEIGYVEQVYFFDNKPDKKIRFTKNDGVYFVDEKNEKISTAHYTWKAYKAIKEHELAEVIEFHKGLEVNDDE